MSNLVERLRNTVTQSIGYMGHNELSVSDLQLEAADEIERLRHELVKAANVARVAGHNSLCHALLKAMERRP